MECGSWAYLHQGLRLLNARPWCDILIAKFKQHAARGHTCTKVKGYLMQDLGVDVCFVELKQDALHEYANSKTKHY